LKLGLIKNTNEVRKIGQHQSPQAVFIFIKGTTIECLSLSTLQKDREISVKNKLEAQQLFKISPFREVIKRTKPHKHDAYFELIYLSEGAGFHWIDTEKFQIRPPVVYFLSGQLHYWEMTSIPKGYVLLFKEAFFDFFKQGELLTLIRNFQGSAEINLAGTDNLDYLFSEMVKEYKEPFTHSAELIQGYLQVVLIKLLRNRQDTEVSDGTMSGNSLYRKFIQFIQNAHPIGNLKVNEIASSLNVSPQHLNGILKKVSGKSASELIAAQVLLEAKRYLIHTDKTVSEIAFALSFTDPSHFVKHFKKATAETPHAFRIRHFQ
jgi:AraC family transcriptional activator of pobA